MQIIQESRGTFEGVIGQTRVTLLYYQYPIIDALVEKDGIRLASVKDIALMKLSAVSSRGCKKDFIDLYFLKDRFSWKELFDLFDRKFTISGYNLLHIIKSLTYFDDAEEEPMPVMLKPVQWEMIKQHFIEEETKIIKDRLLEGYE